MRKPTSPRRVYIASAAFWLGLAAALAFGLAGDVTYRELRGPLTDRISLQRPPLIEASALAAAGLAVIEFRSDSMYRNGPYPIKLVFDETAFLDKAPRRGDVVVLQLPRAWTQNDHSEDIQRVIGLPGERVRIAHGLVYINRRRLDTFYGRQYYGNEPVLSAAGESMAQDIVLGAGEYFCMADQWWRSGYGSLYEGAIPASMLRGKVVGYLEEPVPPPPPPLPPWDRRMLPSLKL